MPDTPPSEVFLRLGSHSEKQYVIKTFRLFHGVLVGANLLESTPGAIRPCSTVLMCAMTE
jgi:hypothetical protein